MKVAKIMHKVIVVEDDITLKETARLMSKKKIGSLLYVKNGEIKGILTERDIIKHIGKLNSKISCVMSKRVVTVNAHDVLEDAAEIMNRNKIKRLPVVVGDQLVGIVTATDLVAHSDGFEFF